jgi:tetratricopeptide (TPR) repeat protein
MWEIGNLKKAKEFYLLALKNETESMTIASLHNQIGTVYDDIGNHSKALEHYEQSLTIKQSYLPLDDPSFAALYGNIGLAYQNLGNNIRGLTYLKKALVIAEKMSKPNQQILGSIHNSIAGILDEQCQYDEALEHYQKGLQYRLACLPSTHPDIATSYSDWKFNKIH